MVKYYGTMTIEKSEFSFGDVFPNSDCTKFHYDQVVGEKLSMIKIFKFFVSDHIKILCDTEPKS